MMDERTLWDREPSAQALMESDSLFEALGIQCHFAPDDLAPPVNEEQLRRFLRKQLSAEEERETCQLIAGFRNWHAAWRRLVRGDVAP